MNGNYGLGPTGYCICPKCKYKIPHQRGVPCQEVKCPQCGSILVREGSSHHDVLTKRQQKNSQ